MCSPVSCSTFFMSCSTRASGIRAAMSVNAAAIQPGSPAAVDDEVRDDGGAFSLRGAGRLLVASGTGKAAIALFLVMLGISAYVLFTYPLHFGPDKWSNPIIWADNPKTVAQKWMKWLGKDTIEHQTMLKTAPTSV